MGDKEREKRFETVDPVQASVPEHPDAEAEAADAEAIPRTRETKRERPEAEMGGEAPCQLHNFWDVDE